MMETLSERTRNVYARISIICSLASFLAFLLYGTLHTHLMHLKLSGGQSRWLSWNIIDVVHFTSFILAVAALILALVSLKQRPRRIAVYALMIAMSAFIVSFFIFV